MYKTEHVISVNKALLRYNCFIMFRNFNGLLPGVNLYEHMN